MLYFEFWSHDRFVGRKYDHEIEFWKALLGNFNLMIKVSTSWSILLDKFDLMNKHNFDLMKNEKKFDLMNSTLWKREFWSHEIRPPDPESLKGLPYQRTNFRCWLAIMGWVLLTCFVEVDSNCFSRIRFARIKARLTWNRDSTTVASERRWETWTLKSGNYSVILNT